jgi:hypothetical protein
MRTPSFKWMCYLLIVLTLLASAWMTRFKHITFQLEWVGPESRQLEVREVIWDRWRQEACILIKGLATQSEGTRSYRRNECWPHWPPPRRQGS